MQSSCYEAAVGKLLHAIGDSADKQVAAQPGRVTLIRAEVQYGVAVRSDLSALRFFELALVETSRWCLPLD